jgi:predicted oxidoreductase
MSGGHWEYIQYRFTEIADELAIASKDETSNPNLAFHYKQAEHALRVAQVYLQRIDWFWSGDDGEESFLERLTEELVKLADTPTPREQELEAQIYARDIEILNVHKNHEHLSQIQRGKTVDADKAFNDLVAMIDRLEAQNKALIAGLARIMAKDAYQDYPEGPIKHGPLGTEALETLAAIQKAKEAR